VRRPAILAIACGVVALAGCGGRGDPPVALPSSGTAYRGLGEAGRLDVARSCRDRAAARAHGLAARQLRAVDAGSLRTQLDDAFTIISEQRRPVAELCAERLPFVTPGLDLTFAGANDGGDGRFTVETTSDQLLTIRGRLSPAPPGGRVVARRETGAPGRYPAAVGADGRFVISRLHLRRIADNTFTLTIDAPPNAARKVHFSAICLDCLAGTPAPPPPS
jgi:hypothetical protein